MMISLIMTTCRLMIMMHKMVTRKTYSVGEDSSNMCKDVVIEAELMQLHVEIDLHEDVELQSGLQHALDVLVDEQEILKCPF